jgi:hypothetical protein
MSSYLIDVSRHSLGSCMVEGYLFFASQITTNDISHISQLEIPKIDTVTRIIKTTRAISFF